jgi:hypothetical protein
MASIAVLPPVDHMSYYMLRALLFHQTRSIRNSSTATAPTALGTQPLSLYRCHHKRVNITTLLVSITSGYCRLL